MLITQTVRKIDRLNWKGDSCMKEHVNHLKLSFSLRPALYRLHDGTNGAQAAAGERCRHRTIHVRCRPRAWRDWACLAPIDRCTLPFPRAPPGHTSPPHNRLECVRRWVNSVQAPMHTMQLHLYTGQSTTSLSRWQRPPRSIRRHCLYKNGGKVPTGDLMAVCFSHDPKRSCPRLLLSVV